jgi:hypothetical protein
MSLSIVHSRAQIGVDAPAVTVEVHLANGLPSLTMVGLPEAAVKESKDRVRSAIINSGLQFPARRITLNLAPADLPKDGGRFDLAIALGILSASVQVPAMPKKRQTPDQFHIFCMGFREVFEQFQNVLYQYITCCSADHPGPGKRCWRVVCRGCFLLWPKTRRWKSQPFNPSPVACP